VSFFIYGSRLYLELKKLGYNKHAQINLVCSADIDHEYQTQILQLFYLTAVCSVSMVLQCVFMLVLVIISNSNNIAALST